VAVTTNHYELIVLGSDIAGLVAAALVARRGKRVLVIPDGSVDGAYRLGARNLPLDTSPVVHMGTPPVQRVFHELGLLQMVKRQHASVDGLIHLVLPNQRLDLEPQETNFFEEARRQWPDDPIEEAWALQRRWSEATDEVLEQLLSSDNALLADGFWGRRFLSRVATQLPGEDVDPLEPLAPDHPLRAGARCIEPWLQHLSPAQLGRAASLRLRGLWSNGPEDLPGGLMRLRELLLQRISLHSGEIKRDLRVAELLVKRGRVVGISLLGKRDRYGCDHMIIATDPRRLLDGPLGPHMLPKALANTLTAIETVADRFVMHAEIDAAGLSPALAGLVLSVPARADLATDPDEARLWHEHGVGSTYVRLFPGSNEDLRRISITRLLPAGSSLDGVRDRIIDDLDEAGVLPFCRPYIRWMHSPYDGLPPTDGHGTPIAESGPNAMPQPMSSVYVHHGDLVLGVGVLPHASGIRSLHFASRLTLPGLGLEGEFAAGLIAASMVASPAKSPLSRSPLLSRV
jgi:phytoene dehydrogenase-like protein